MTPKIRKHKPIPQKRGIRIVKVRLANGLATRRIFHDTSINDSLQSTVAAFGLLNINCLSTGGQLYTREYLSELFDYGLE